MNKIFTVAIISLVVFFSLLGLDRHIEQVITDTTNYFRSKYVDNAIGFQDFIETYYSQTDTIAKLKHELITEKNKNLILTKEVNELRNTANAKLYIDLNRTTIPNPDDKRNSVPKNYTLKLEGKLEKVKVLSFIDFKDYSRVYLDYSPIDLKIRGLLYDNHVVGIAQSENGRMVGLLNGNEKCGYSVYIGKDKIIGVTAGIKHSNNILVKYIPTWLNIKNGDEVVTSGMDGIFFEGIKVGIVKSVQRKPMYQEAIVEPYQEAIDKKLLLMYSTK